MIVQYVGITIFFGQVGFTRSFKVSLRKKYKLVRQQNRHTDLFVKA